VRHRMIARCAISAHLAERTRRLVARLTAQARVSVSRVDRDLDVVMCRAPQCVFWSEDSVLRGLPGLGFPGDAVERAWRAGSASGRGLPPPTFGSLYTL
jgi:hypothetical protein